MTTARRYVIVGSGAAGLAAAQVIREQDPAGQLTMLTDDRHRYYSRPGLAYYLSGEVPGDQIFPYPPAYFDQLRLQLRVAPVARIDAFAHQVALSDGGRVPYDRLLIATGAVANRLDLPGADARGVVKLDSMDDATGILQMAKKGQSAVVVGGGITALELAEGLCARGMKVHYLLRGDRYWSAILDEEESRIVERRLQHDGIRIHYQAQVTVIHARKGELAGVRILEDGKTLDLPCRLLGVAIGIQPNKTLAAASGIVTRQGVVIDPYLRTSAADVFAAGDVAELVNPVTGESLLDSLWGPAIEQGRAAGAVMAGAETPFRKKPPFNVTRLSGLVTTIIGQVGKPRKDGSREKGDADLKGIMRGDSEQWRTVPDAVVAQTLAGDSRVRVFFNAYHMVGALVMGDQALSRPLQYLIREGVDISALRPALVAPQAPLADLIQRFFNDARQQPRPS